MSRHLLLTGALGVGKSSIIADQLQDSTLQTTGFTTCRVTARKQEESFRLHPVGGEVPLSGGATFIKWEDNSWLRYQRAFSGLAMALLAPERVAQSDLVLLDKIGGYELLLPDFEQRLRELMSGSTPCIGVLKSQVNSKKLARALSLNEGYSRVYHQFFEFLAANPHVEILTVTSKTRKQVAAQVHNFLNGIVPIRG